MLGVWGVCTLHAAAFLASAPFHDGFVVVVVVVPVVIVVTVVSSSVVAAAVVCGFWQ